MPEVDYRDADLPDLPFGFGRIRVVAGLGGQVEGHRQSGLPLGQVGAVQLVGCPGRGVAGIGPHHPGWVGGRAAGPATG